MNESASPKIRYPELDLLRTLAVACMVLYHGAYDLAAFYGWNIDLDALPWVLLQRGTASLFLLLVGIGFAISWDRTTRQAGPRYRKYARRGLGLIACGMAVTVVTYVIDPWTYVRFGILHLIGTSMLLLPLATRLRTWGNAIGGSVVIAIGWMMRASWHDAPTTGLLIPFGITPPWFASVDYFPVMPWFGVAMIGSAIGRLLYVEHLGWRQGIARQRPYGIFTWPGRNALAIYLVHQPILLLVLWAILGTPAF